MPLGLRVLLLYLYDCSKLQNIAQNRRIEQKIHTYETGYLKFRTAQRHDCSIQGHTGKVSEPDTREFPLRVRGRETRNNCIRHGTDAQDNNTGRQCRRERKARNSQAPRRAPQGTPRPAYHHHDDQRQLLRMPLGRRPVHDSVLPGRRLS